MTELLDKKISGDATESIIYDLKLELSQLLLQVAIIQKSIAVLGGEYEPRYCGCCSAVCDEQYELCYSHLDKYLKIIFKDKKIVLP